MIKKISILRNLSVLIFDFSLFFICFGLFCLFFKRYLFLFSHGKKFLGWMTEISAVKAIFYLRSRTEIRNATCVNF